MTFSFINREGGLPCSGQSMAEVIISKPTPRRLLLTVVVNLGPISWSLNSKKSCRDPVHKMEQVGEAWQAKHKLWYSPIVPHTNLW